jgi:hypothetical protein
MIQVDIKIDNQLSKDLARIQKQLQNYPQEALAEYKNLTPKARVNGGNARRNTTLKGSRIEANYPYAQRLDSGWSKQAPQGMTKPFLQWVSRRMKQIFGK